MGNIGLEPVPWTCVLPKGLSTTILELLKSDRIFGAVSLNELHRLANWVAEKVTSAGDLSLDGVISKSAVSSFLSTISCDFTKRQFFECCKKVVAKLCEKINGLPKEVATKLLKALKDAVETVASLSSSPLVRDFFNHILPESASTSSKTLQVVRSASGAVAEEVVENVSKLTKASQGAKSALKFGLVVDGAIAVGTIGYYAHKYKNDEITGKEFKRVAIRRSSGAVGSVGMGAVGTFVGTLIFPGVGSFIGGFIGGMAGDYTGSWVGGKIDDNT